MKTKKHDSWVSKGVKLRKLHLTKNFLTQNIEKLLKARRCPIGCDLNGQPTGKEIVEYRNEICGHDQPCESKEELGEESSANEAEESNEGELEESEDPTEGLLENLLQKNDQISGTNNLAIKMMSWTLKLHSINFHFVSIFCRESIFERQEP